MKLTRPLKPDDNADMNSGRGGTAVCIVVIFLSLFSLPVVAQKGSVMSGRASGTFEVKIVSLEDKPAVPTMERRSIDKTFHGDLEGTSQGQMLSASTDVKGSAGYVAIERVTATLKTNSGTRSGNFALQHNATMNRGTPEMNIVVVPDSGTGQLSGLTGRFNVIIADGKHSYEFDYTLPDSKP